jgi:hypothetical protein
VDYVITAEDRQLFKRCRQAWDLGATSRQNQEPMRSTLGFDLDKALHYALAVYYYPGMWEWGRVIVGPIARQAFRRAVKEQREAGRRVDDEQAALGETMLDGYLAWAPTVDQLKPLRVETLFTVTVPDPERPGFGLVTPEGRGVRFQGRVDAVVADERNACWIVDHRIAYGAWATLDDLVLDERAVTACWAWEQFYLGMKIAGTIHNELLAAPPTGGSAAAGALHDSPPYGSTLIKRQGTARFRRTTIRRTRSSYEAAAVQLSDELRVMTGPELRVYPSPETVRCRPCEYRAPCVALATGDDPQPVLAAGYRRRPKDDQTGRLGVDIGFQTAQSTRDLPVPDLW